jgi:hypothetical protein
MSSPWQMHTGHLALHWTETGQNLRSDPQSMDAGTRSSYLTPLPDFASHSPFGGAFWFLPHLAYQFNRPISGYDSDSRMPA